MRTGAEVKAARRHPSKIQRRLPPSDSPPLSSSAPRRVAPPHPTPPTGSSQPRPSSRRPASSSLTPPCRPPWLPVRPSHRCLTREVHKSRAKRRPRR
uniref:Uncharacterized protein n=1 Tax=Arundo donax TaxID=35708 RepID=A0A0A9ESG1_ARUDO